MGLFGRKNTQLSEVQILKKIDAWDDQDKICAIIDFVEPHLSS